MVKYLVEHGADKDKAESDGVSPLYIAAQNGHLTVVQYLVEQGADKDRAENDGIIHSVSQLRTATWEWFNISSS